jgi:hypothetical protein
MVEEKYLEMECVVEEKCNHGKKEIFELMKNLLCQDYNFEY